jgi:two-component system, NtrC family, sensor kinase
MLRRYRWPMAIALGLALLWGLLWAKPQGFHLDRHQQLAADLRQMEQQDAVLGMIVLKIKVQLDPNYDQLTQAVQQFQVLQTRVNAHLPSTFREVGLRAAATQTPQTLQRTWHQRQMALEQFKSNVAIFNNSHRYLNHVIASLLAREATIPAPLQVALRELLQAMLTTDRQPQGGSLTPIVTALEQLAKLQSTAPIAQRSQIADVVTHGQIQLQSQMRINDLTPQLTDQSMGRLIEDILQNYEQRYSAALAKILGLLGLLVLCTVGLGIYAAILYRARVRSQRMAQINQRLEHEVQSRTAELSATLVQLQQSQSQLIQAEKMSSLGQLIAGIAHEINNPVSFIYGNIQPAQRYIADLLQLIDLYQDHVQIPASVAAWADEIDLPFLRTDLPKSLDSMLMGADRIRQIVLSLRNFSRLDEAAQKAVDLHEGIDSTLLLLKHRLNVQPHRVAILIQKDYGDLPPVLCYASQINQVMMNLLVNAIDALECEIPQRGPQFRPQITISTAITPDQRVRIQIMDNGPGIPELVQAKIFDPFFTTKDIGKGTGMGLAISYQIIVDRHQGQLRCVSVAGSSTTFEILLPLQLDPSPAIDSSQSGKSVLG